VVNNPLTEVKKPLILRSIFHPQVLEALTEWFGVAANLLEADARQIFRHVIFDVYANVKIL
jgi:hypothetical protein